MATSEKVKAESKRIQLVIFKLRDEEFGIDINSVVEISRMLEITHIPQTQGFIEGVVNLRGRLIAVVDLAKRFNFEPIKEIPKTTRIVIVNVEDKVVGLRVDEVPEVLKIEEERIEKTPEIIKTKLERNYIKGVGKVKDRLIILLNLEKALSSKEIEQIKEINKKN